MVPGDREIDAALPLNVQQSYLGHEVGTLRCA